MRIVAYAATHSNFCENHVYSTLWQWIYDDINIEGDRRARSNVHSRNLGRKSRSPPQHGRTFPLDNREYAENEGDEPDTDSSRISHLSIGEWYRCLLKDGFLWESHRFLKAILPILGLENFGQYVPNGSFERFA